MKTILARIGLAAMIVTGGLAGLAPAAHADDFGIEFRFGDGGRDRHWDYNEWRRDRGLRHAPDQDLRFDPDRERGRQLGCFPGNAIKKARWQGIRRPQIDYITPRKLVVSGWSSYGRERIIFANVRGCPVISY